MNDRAAFRDYDRWLDQPYWEQDDQAEAEEPGLATDEDAADALMMADSDQLDAEYAAWAAEVDDLLAQLDGAASPSAPPYTHRLIGPFFGTSSRDEY